MQIDVNGVKITLTKEQLAEINIQVNKSKSITERIETLKDVINELGSPCLLAPFPNPNTPYQKYLNACAILPQIAKAYNEGVVLDMKNSNQYKYFPYKYFSGGSVSVAVADWYYCLLIPIGFYFANKAHAEDALKKFREIFDNYWDYTG